MPGSARRALAISAALLALCSSGAQATRSAVPTKPVSSRYLVMRDGTRIAVEIVLPDSALKGKRVPTVMDATRYGRRSNLEVSLQIAGAGVAVVLVDARGTGASFGQWVVFGPQEIGDYREIVDWIAAQPWSNGRVATFGVSYDGATAELTATRRPPALKAVVPTFFTDDPYDDVVYPGGVYNQRNITWWSGVTREMDRGGAAVPVDGDTGQKLLSQAIAEHAGNMDVADATARAPYRDDAIAPITYADISPETYRPELAAGGLPFLVLTGWLDGADARGALRRYLNLPNPQVVLIGPWNHGATADANPFRPTAASPDSSWYPTLASFLASTLLGAGAPPARVIRYFTLGENRWHESKTWPPRGLVTRTLYLAPGASLRSARPAAGEDRYRVRFDATTGLRNRWLLSGQDVVYPDRRAEDRKLLTYTSSPLPRATEVTGTVAVSLQLASTAKDGAVFAYLEDVAPGGRVTYVTEGELRLASRKLLAPSSRLEAGGPLHPFTRAASEPLVPGRAETVRIGMVPTSVLFRKGHRIRLAIAGADRGTFARLPASGTPTLTIFRGASWIELPSRSELSPRR